MDVTQGERLALTDHIQEAWGVSRYVAIWVEAQIFQRKKGKEYRTFHQRMNQKSTTS